MRKLTKSSYLHSRFSNTLLWLWGSWFALSIMKALHYQTWRLETQYEVSLALILAHAVIVALTLLASGPPKFAGILIGAYLARILTLLVDRFATFNVPFLSDLGDADAFFSAASSVANDLSLAGETYGGAYAALLGYLFYFIGPDRLLGQYLNVLLGLTTVILISGILRQLQISQRVSNIVLPLAAFMPMIIVHSSVLLREPLIQAFVTAALLTFVRGLLETKLTWTFIAVLWVLAASVFHSGVIGVLLAFAFISAFTYQKNGRLFFGLKRIAPVFLIITALAVVLLLYPELFLGKFQTLESPEDLLETGLSTRGDAAYLTSLEVNDWLTFILYAPLRAFYFIASPLPWDWRGLNDVIAFVTDSAVYISVGFFFFAHRIRDPNRRYLAVALALTLLVSSLIFGIGVSNSGTAIRHRGKLIGIFLVLLAVVLDAPRKKNRQTVKTVPTKSLRNAK